MVQVQGKYQGVRQTKHEASGDVKLADMIRKVYDLENDNPNKTWCEFCRNISVRISHSSFEERTWLVLLAAAVLIGR